MKRWIFAGLITVALSGLTVRAQEKFSQTVRPEDFVAAGLAQLTPAERARLDRLIAACKRGAPVPPEAMAEKLAAALSATNAAAAARRG